MYPCPNSHFKGTKVSSTGFNRSVSSRFKVKIPSRTVLANHMDGLRGLRVQDLRATRPEDVEARATLYLHTNIELETIYESNMYLNTVFMIQYHISCINSSYVLHTVFLRQEILSKISDFEPRPMELFSCVL